MASKKRKKVTKSLVVSAKLTPELVRWLDRWAATSDFTRSSGIEMIILNFRERVRANGITD